MLRFALILSLSLFASACSSSDTIGSGVVPDASGPGRFATQLADAGASVEDVSEEGTTEPATEDASGPSGLEDVEVAEPTCEEGKACNDGDLCTKNDVCADGVCAGESISCEDEPSAPCETATCVEGICEVTIDDGFCFIDGSCWTEGQPNENEPCQRCVPVLATTTWSNNDGASCGAGDVDLCNPSSCQGGACVTTPVECVDGDDNPCTEPGCVAGVCEPQELSGTPCDDGDPCTTGDLCDKGNCLGGATDCDDGLSCTSDACDGAACLHVVDAGFCAIDGMCLAAGEANPLNPCEVCDPALDEGAWTALDGDPCEDGSSCTSGDTCQLGVCAPGTSMCPDDGNPCTVPTCEDNLCDMIPAPTGIACDDQSICTVGDSCSGGVCVGGPPPAEICDDALDNDCDGSTDEDCAPAPTGCDYHNDCYPEKLCGDWYTTDVRVCSDPCAGDSDCADGFICTKVPGSVNAGYCQPALGAGGSATPCVDGTECESGFCLNGGCAAVCLDQQHCLLPNHSCQMVGAAAYGFAGSACVPNAGLMTQGMVCLDQQNFNSSACASGHCDLTAVLNNDVVCSNLCTSQSDCAVGQMCGMVFHAAPPTIGGTTNPDSVPYHPLYTQPTYDAVAGCFTSSFGVGEVFDGIPCTANNQCQTGHCLPLIPDDPTRYCTRMCSLDSDCPHAGMQCKLDVVNLVSAWLEDHGTYNESATSLVRICKFN